MKTKSSGRVITLSLMGASLFALAACKEDQMQATVMKDVQACMNVGVSQAECESQMSAAQTEHHRSAPRYDSVALCEEEHGKGNCDAPVANNNGGGSVVMPLMAGFIAGQMLSNMSSGSNRAQEDERRRSSGGVIAPIYSSSSGGYSTANGNVRTQGLSGQTTTRASALAKAPTTAGKAPMTRATVSSRGGFGAARAGGFGG